MGLSTISGSSSDSEPSADTAALEAAADQSVIGVQLALRHATASWGRQTSATTGQSSTDERAGTMWCGGSAQSSSQLYRLAQRRTKTTAWSFDARWMMVMEATEPNLATGRVQPAEEREMSVVR